MDLLLQTLVNGVLVGGLYVTISIGFALAFGVLDVVDFAVGEWVMLGAFAAVGVQSWLGVDPFVMLPAVSTWARCSSSRASRRRAASSRAAATSSASRRSTTRAA